MFRTMSWGVAAGATLLISLTACAQPGTGTAATGGTGDVCSLLAAPVTAQLIQAGITATPVNDGTSSACQWKEASSETTVTLKTDAAAATGKDGQAVETTTVPGAGEVKVVGPGEVAFTAAGRPWDLKVESKNSDEVDTEAATDLVATITAAIGGGAGAGAGVTAEPTASEPTGSATAGVETTDYTVTLTDNDGRKTDLRSSTTGTTVGGFQGGGDLDLGNGQTVPLKTIAKITIANNGSDNMDVTVTTTDGKQATGKVLSVQQISGGSDFGEFSQSFGRTATVEFRRDTPFVATPDPTTLNAFGSAIATVVAKDGTSKVKAATLKCDGEAISLDNGQTVSFRRIAKVTLEPVTDGRHVTITLVNGKTVDGTILAGRSFDGDTDGGPFQAYASDVTSITIDRG